MCISGEGLLIHSINELKEGLKWQEKKNVRIHKKKLETPRTTQRDKK